MIPHTFLDFPQYEQNNNVFVHAHTTKQKTVFFGGEHKNVVCCSR